MPGRDKTKHAIAEVGKRELELWAFIEAGRGLPYAADQMGIPRYYIREWLKQDPKRTERYKEGRKDAADCFVDKARDTLEKAEINGASLAKAQADHYRWAASRLDPQQWGDGPKVAIQINAHESYVEGLRQALAKTVAPDPIGWDGNGSPTK